MYQHRGRRHGLRETSGHGILHRIRGGTDSQGFGVTARSTLDTRKLDPTGIIVFHQADVGEFLRDEDTMF